MEKGRNRSYFETTYEISGINKQSLPNETKNEAKSSNDSKDYDVIRLTEEAALCTKSADPVFLNDKFLDSLSKLKMGRAHGSPSKRSIKPLGPGKQPSPR
ncbi:unnamed protein product [Dovyalis caffra]|uniref:Uncharacterized protein n=1 Tax=Dovyalis caffra TaxID=77055 RepID=A0AAV1QTQ6_9ROSI|nr:unnamed protein product [Dovyalis caffra]